MNTPSNSNESERTLRAILGGLALVLVGAGQMAWWATPDGLTLGAVLSVLGAGLLWGANWPTLPRGLTALAGRWRLSARGARVTFAGLLALLTVAADLMWVRYGQTNYLPVLVLWGASALMYVAAFVDAPPEWKNARDWLGAHRGEVAGVLLLTLAGAALRFYQLGGIPRVIDGDEGRIGQYALITTQLPSANPFVLVENFGALYLQIINFSLSVFGQNPFALRLAPAVGGVLAIPAVYLLGRQLLGARVAFWAAGLLAFSHAHIHFSRIASVAYIQGAWLAPLELYFFLSGLQRRSAWRMALGGVLLGMHFSIYITAQIVAPLLLVYWLVALALRLPLAQKTGRLVAAFWVGVLVTAMPLGVYALQYPADFFARLNADGTFQTGWLAQTMADTGQSAAAILVERVMHAFLSLSYYPAIDFYGAGVPLFNVVTSTLFVLGLAYALWRTRDPQYLLLNGYFWAITVAIGIFSVPPSADSYRMLAALPAAILLAAVGLEKILTLMFGDAPRLALFRAASAGFVLVVVLVLGLRTYYSDFALKCKYGGDLQTRFASYLGNYLRGLDPESTVHLLSDDSFRYGTHGSVDFLSNNFPVLNMPDPVTSLTLTPGTVLIAVPSRVEELRAWSADQPGGQVHIRRDCGNLILAAYHLGE